MKYVPSLAIGQLSGSTGSTTASRNRYGSYFRNRVMPANPSTSLQLLWRSRLQTLAQTWKTLSSDNQAGWSALGQLMVRLGSLGEEYNLTGAQAFQSVNSSLLLIGQATVTAPPAFSEVPALTSLSLTAGTAPNVLSAAFAPTPVPTGLYVVLEATSQRSAGVTYIDRSDFRFLQRVNPAGTSPANILLAYSAKFGPLQNGRKIFVRARVISAAGFSSSPVQATTIVTGPA